MYRSTNKMKRSLRSNLDLRFEQRQVENGPEAPWLRNLYHEEKKTDIGKYKNFEKFNAICLMEARQFRNEGTQQKKVVDSYLNLISSDYDKHSHNSLCVLTRHYTRSAFSLRTHFGKNQNELSPRRLHSRCDILSSNTSGDLHISHSHIELLVRYGTDLHYTKKIYLNATAWHLISYEYKKLNEIKFQELLRVFADFSIHRQLFISNKSKHCMSLHVYAPVNFIDHGAPMRMLAAKFESLTRNLKFDRKWLESNGWSTRVDDSKKVKEGSPINYQPLSLQRLAADAAYLVLSKKTLTVVLNFSIIKQICLPKSLKYFILHRQYHKYDNSASVGIVNCHAMAHRHRFLSGRGPQFINSAAPYDSVLFEPKESIVSCNGGCKTYHFYYIATCSYLSKMRSLGVTVKHSGDSDLCAELRHQMITTVSYDARSLMRSEAQRVLVRKRMLRMIKYMDGIYGGWKQTCLNYFRVSLYWPHCINSVDHPRFHTF